MNPLFSTAIDFVWDTVRCFYSGEDIERVVGRFTDDFSWVGAGEVEFTCDAGAAVSYLRERAPLAPACDVFDEEFFLVNVQEHSCTVMGRYNVRTRPETGMALEERQRCSYELIDAGGVLKVRHVHVSNPYQPMKDESFFPFEVGMQSYEYLQELVREKTATIDMMAANINGGLKMSEDDDSFTFAYVNEGLARMLGYTVDEFMEMSGGTAAGAVYPPDLPRALDDVDRCFSQGNTYETEYRIRRKDGALTWVLDSGRKTQTADGLTKIGSVLMDITTRKQTELALQIEQERYRIAMRSVTDVLFEYDIATDTLLEFERDPDANEGDSPVERRVEGYSRQIAEGKCMHAGDHEQLSRALEASSTATMDVRLPVPGREGEWRWARLHVTLLFDPSGRPERTIGSRRDVTEERSRIEQLEDAARRDPLTKLYNQGVAAGLVQEALLKAGAGALMVIDVDDFKTVNDSFGHLVGDELLMRVARVLDQAFAQDGAVIARVGGDEFLAYLPACERSQAVQAAARASRDVEQLGGSFPPVTLSMGAVLADGAAQTYEELFAAADRALYRAKREGKNCLRFADDSK